MRLPWYVGLDRWIRRNPVTASGLQWLATWTVMVVVGVSLRESLPSMIMAGVVLSVAFWWHWSSVLARQLLEHVADKWREECFCDD